jgi:hypothetical protein
MNTDALPQRAPFVGPPLPMDLLPFELLPVDQLERFTDAVREWAEEREQ